VLANRSDAPLAGLFDSGGIQQDHSNIKAIVDRLKEKGRVNTFLLVLNATNVRFSPQVC
jgi:hypothetical protein